MRRVIAILTLVIFISSSAFAADAELLFDAGNRAYLDGDWQEALNKWSQIETQGYTGGQLFYNLGNAYFKSGQLGEAILYWEKAAKLLGEDGDIAANLKIARARIEDKLDDQVRLPVWDWFDKLRDRLASSYLVMAGILLSFLTFASLGLKRWYFRTGSGSQQLKWTALFFGLFLILDLTIIGFKAYDENANKLGVFVADESEVLSAPALGTGKLLFTLHEGTKVRVLRSLEGWYEVSAGKEKQGWVKAENLGII